MINLKHKLRRPGNEESAVDGATNEHDNRQVQSMECSPILTKTRAKTEINETITIRVEESSPPLKEAKSHSNMRVNFVPESENLVRRFGSCEADLASSALASDDEEPHNKIVEKENAAPLELAPAPAATSPRLTRNKKRDSANSASVQSVKDPEEPKKQEPKSPVAQPPKKTTRTTRKTKKTETVAEDKVQVVQEKPIELKENPPVEKAQEPAQEKQIDLPSKEATVEKEPEPEVVAKKKTTRKARKGAEEKQTAPAPPAPPTAATASPRVTRNQKRDSNQHAGTSAAPCSPRVDRTPLKKSEMPRGSQFQSPRSSPVKKVFTPKLVFRYLAVSFQC